jgi:preprotein translocase SecE subunit
MSENNTKKPNFFVRVWRKICKFTKDVCGEMKKVVWTPKDELKKSTKLVLVIVATVAIAIAIIDTTFSWVINSIAGLVG